MDALLSRPWAIATFAAAALLSAIGAYWLTQRYLVGRENSIRDRYAARYQERQVLVAARAVPAGHPLGLEDLARRSMPAGFLPSGTLADADVELALGRRLREPLQAGDPVRTSTLASGAATALSALLQPGERAVTLMVDEVNALAGLLRPGDLIDLYWAVEQGEGTGGGPSVRPLMHSVPVLATGERIAGADAGARDGADDGDAGDFGSITLRLSAEAAARLSLAQRSGELIAMLRASGDARPEAGATVTLATLRGEAPRRRVARGVQTSGVELWSGGMGSLTARREWLQPLAGTTP